MEPLTLYAPAKVNLTLTVGDRRPDGYHDVSTVMQAVGLYDTLILFDRKIARIDISPESCVILPPDII